MQHGNRKRKGEAGHVATLELESAEAADFWGGVGCGVASNGRRQGRAAGRSSVRSAFTAFSCSEALWRGPAKVQQT